MENKQEEVKGIKLMGSDQQVHYKLTDPVFNENTTLWEIKKEDAEGNVIDIIADGDRENLLNKREELIKQFILSKINQSGKRREIIGTEGKELQSKLKRAADGSPLTEKEELIAEIIKRKLEGQMIHDIVNELAIEYNRPRVTIGLYIDQAMDEIKQRTAAIIDEVLELHIGRYESLYKWFYENGFIKYATKTLKTKEALMGVGQDVVMGVEVNNYLTMGEIDGKQYSLGQLNKEQRKRMLELVGKIQKRDGK